MRGVTARPKEVGGQLSAGGGAAVVVTGVVRCAADLRAHADRALGGRAGGGGRADGHRAPGSGRINRGRVPRVRVPGGRSPGVRGPGGRVLAARQLRVVRGFPTHRFVRRLQSDNQSFKQQGLVPFGLKRSGPPMPY